MPAGTKRKASLKNDQSQIEKPTQGKSIELMRLGESEYDLRDKMGKVLKRLKKVDFQSWYTIKDAYVAAFGNEVEDIFDLPDHADMGVIESMRNLIAHRAGIVDQQFIDDVGNHPRFHGISINDEIEVDGLMAVEFHNCTARLGVALINHVEKKLEEFKSTQ